MHLQDGFIVAAHWRQLHLGDLHGARASCLEHESGQGLSGGKTAAEPCCGCGRARSSNRGAHHTGRQVRHGLDKSGRSRLLQLSLCQQFSWLEWRLSLKSAAQSAAKMP